MGKVIINIESEVDNETIGVHGNISGSLENFAKVVGFALGNWIKDAPDAEKVKVEDAVFICFLEGMASAKYGETVNGYYNKMTVPTDVIREITKKGDSEK